MSEIIPTVVPKSLEAVATLVTKFKGIAETLHIDATDGDFAFPTTWVPKEGDMLPHYDGIYEAHLMVRDARAYGEAFARAGAWRIIAHVESLGTIEEAQRTIDLWKVTGAHEAGAAILFDSPLSILDALAPYIDCVHIMTIAKIGAQGAQLEERAIERVREVRSQFPHMPISVDGGVNESNIAQLAQAGATRFCVGAAEANAPDPIAEYHKLLALADMAVG